MTIEEIDAKAAELVGRFMPQTNWSGFPKELGKSWHYHHIFTAPFYYIEYGLSWLGALQLWQNSLLEPKQSIAAIPFCSDSWKLPERSRTFQSGRREVCFRPGHDSPDDVVFAWTDVGVSRLRSTAFGNSSYGDALFKIAPQQKDWKSRWR